MTPITPHPPTHTHTDHRLENAQISECVENVYMRMRKVMIFFIHNIKSLLPSLRIKMVKIMSIISLFFTLCPCKIIGKPYLALYYPPLPTHTSQGQGFLCWGIAK